ncbi:MAG: beta-ketoacyl synthase N-terminal-like domain-containing protein, partial [Pseudomonadota bacterium]
MPKSADVERFWSRLLSGVDSFETIPEDRWSRAHFYDEDPSAPDKTYCDTGGFLPEIAFDPLEFGLPPSALASIDSSQLLALKAAAAALDDAGHPPGDPIHARTSVILGIAGTTMKALHPLAARLDVENWAELLSANGMARPEIERLLAAARATYPEWTEDSFPGFLANVVAGRIAQRFDLGGITMALDAACASALVALGVAQSEVASGRADLVLTGGVDADNSLSAYMSFSKTPALSPSGRVRAFDKSADGTLVSEGIGMVVLKPLEAAEREGNKIYAILKGVGTASDGRSKSIYAPRASGQRLALERAYEASGVDPASIGFVEAHATGTRVGDEVELGALTSFFADAGAQPRSIALGSAKALTGHAKAAAGAVGLIKAALALDQKVLPPGPAPEEALDDLASQNSPFAALSRARPWLSKGTRRAGVSAFGFGGADAHAVLEEAPRAAARKGRRLGPIARGVMISAPTPAALQESIGKLVSELEGRGGDAAFEALALASRSGVPASEAARLGFMAIDAEEARAALTLALAQLSKSADQPWSLPQGVHYAPVAFGPGDVVAVFPGQGAQFPGMASEAAAAFQELREEISEMSEVLSIDGITDLEARLWPPMAWEAHDKDAAMRALSETLYAQASIGAISLGLWRVLESAGLSATHALGHSFGELPALCAAGVLDPATFSSLVAARGHALTVEEGAEAGTLLAVQASWASISRDGPPLPEGVTLANENGPSQAVLGGPREAIARAAQALGDAGFEAKELSVSAAFHTDLIAER